MPPKPPGDGGYIYLPRTDPSPIQRTDPSPILPALGDYSVGWQYTDPNPPPPSEAATPRHPMTDPPESRYRAEQFREHRYEYEYTSQEALTERPDSPVAALLPVLLCHLCKDCGQMRSAGFHRQHPVVPGKPLVSFSCRRCAKKNKTKKERYIRKSFHVRTCKAEEPCDWPTQDIHIEVGGDRGREKHHRSCSVGVYYDPPGERPQTLRRSESRTNLGLRVLQGIQPPRVLRPRSVSPVHEEHREAETRMAEYPMLYRVLPDQRSFSNRNEGPAISHHGTPRTLYIHPQSPSGGILKQPGMNYQTSYRHETAMRESQESTMVEVGGPKVQFSTEAERRAEKIMLDRNREQSRRHIFDQNSEDYDYFHRHETARYRTEDPQSLPITSFEHLRIRQSSPIRGPYEENRVRHVSPRRFEEPPVRQRSPERQFDKIRVRHVSPPRERVREANVRYESPPPPRGELSTDAFIRRCSPQRHTSDEIRYRYIPEPRRGHSPPREPSPDRPCTTYRTVERREIIEHGYSFPPPRRDEEKEKNWDQVTVTDSDGSGELVDVRTFKATDENGQPVAFVEERRRVRLIEEEKGDSERGGYPQERRGYERERENYEREREKYERDYAREYAFTESYREV